jgi:hypothetical protein
MANFIYSKVTIEPEEAMGKVCDMIRKMPNVEFGKETKNVIDTFYPDYSEDTIDFNWLQNNIGTNWINVFLEDDEINMNSPTIIPAGFLIKLYEICIKDFEDVSITCKWWDETETQCGLALVHSGFYTEDEAYLESESIYDPSYQPSGFEDINVVKDWIQTMLQIEDFNSMSEDDIRDLFENSKIDEKWDTISNNWSQMSQLCDESIKNPHEETPILKLKKIAKMSFEMIPNCYPFEN